MSDTTLRAPPSVPPPNAQFPSASPRIPRTIKGLSVVSLFNDLASEMVYPLLPAFVTRTLGAGPVALGVLDGLAELTSAMVKWGSGHLADRPGWRRPLILGGYLTAVLIRPLIAVTSAAWQVVGFRVLDRIGKGLRTPARDALIADVTPRALRGRAFGFHRGADHFGAVLGSIAAWAFLEAGTGVRSVIAWSVAPGIAAFVLLALVLKREREGGGAAAVPSVALGAGPKTGDRELRDGETPPTAAAEFRPTAAVEAQAVDDPPVAPRHFWLPMFALAALAFARLPEALLLLRLQDAGIAVAIVPLIWAALHVIRSAASYPGGWLADRFGPQVTVAAGGFLFAAGVAVMALRVDPVWVVVGFLGLGGVAGLTESAERALVARLAPARTGRGFGIYHALVGVAALGGGIVFGGLYQRMSGRVALLASAGVLAVATIAWLVVSPDRDQPTG